MRNVTTLGRGHGRRLLLRPGRLVRWCLLGLFNLFWLTFFLFPFYWQTINAFESPRDADALPVHWLPSQLYLGNIRGVLSSALYMHAVLNSAVVASSTTLLTIVLGGLAAYALAKLPFPMKRLFLVLVVILVVFPPIALVPALYVVFLHLHLLDTYVALIASDIGLVLPFTIWVLTNMFRDVPTTLVEQAEVDGCTPMQTLWRVIVPLAAPGLLASALLTFIMVWNEYLFALTLTFTIKSETVTVIVGSYGGAQLSAASTVVTVPVIVLALIGQRGIVRGLTAGAIRG